MAEAKLDFVPFETKKMVCSFCLWSCDATHTHTHTYALPSARPHSEALFLFRMPTQAKRRHKMAKWAMSSAQKKLWYITVEWRASYLVHTYILYITYSYIVPYLPHRHLITIYVKYMKIQHYTATSTYSVRLLAETYGINESMWLCNSFVTNDTGLWTAVSWAMANIGMYGFFYRRTFISGLRA